MNLIYNGVDITENVMIQKCWHEMYAQGRSDILTIRMNDEEGLWDKWNPQPGDEIEVREGNVRTGIMFFQSKVPRGSSIEIVATSVPVSADNKRSKAWQDVHLLQIGREISAIHELEFESYGVENEMYTYILQKSESDFSFLNRLCILEGCAFLIYNKKLVLYSIEYMQNQETAERILLDSTAKYRMFNNEAHAYGSCELIKGDYEASFSEENGSNKVYIPAFEFFVSDNTEALRFAKNLLNYANRMIYEGFFYTDTIFTEYMPGNILEIEVERSGSWNGKVFISKVRNDYVAGRSKVFFWKIKEGET